MTPDENGARRALAFAAQEPVEYAAVFHPDGVLKNA